MKERPILFSGPMILALLDGRKTMTRRVIKPQPEMICDTWHWLKEPLSAGCNTFDELAQEMVARGPYEVGMRLWVKETYRALEEFDHLPPCEIPQDFPIYFEASHQDLIRDSFSIGKVRPSIFMPRWASRITLEVTEVRVQRVGQISEEDAISEGVSPHTTESEDYWEGYNSEFRDRFGNATHTMIPCGDTKLPPDWMEEPRLHKGGIIHTMPARDGFQLLWDSLNGSRPGCSWSENPFVWAISFRRISAVEPGSKGEGL